MALVTLKTPLQWPGVITTRDGNGLTATGAGVRDAAGEYDAYIMQALENMVVTDVALKLAVATGSPTVDIRIETVDATGAPSGTLWATNTNIVTGTLTTTVGVHALTASATINKGQVYCVKVVYNSGTSYQIGAISRKNQVGNFPYKYTNTGTPTKAIAIGDSAIALGSSSTAFYSVPGFLMADSIGGGTFNNTSGARRGLRFTAPFNCRVTGIRHYPSNSTGDYNIIIMDDSGSELSSSSTAIDGDQSGNSQAVVSDIYFDSSVTLTAGVTYRVVVEPSSATNVNFQTIVLSGADYRNASPYGTFGHYTTYASSTWTDSATTTIPYMDLLLDQIDDGSGGGGSSASFSAYVS